MSVLNLEIHEWLFLCALDIVKILIISMEKKILFILRVSSLSICMYKVCTFC